MSTRHVVCLLIGTFVAWITWYLGPTRQSERFVSQPTIFVSIASYRDSDCVNTLLSLFEKADEPTRVFAGVCEQNTADASEVCLPAEFKWHDQVRRISVPSKEAKGPTYARYLCSTLYRGETYFLQLDSHMRFVKGWDSATVEMLDMCDSKKPVITHYPLDISSKGTSDVPVLCKSKYDPATRLATFEAATMPASKKPKPVPFVAGGFMMGLGCMVTEVPYDPDLPHLFQGEELLYSARLWTSGYDFFTPTRNIVYHHYYRTNSPKFWDDIDTENIKNKTVKKVRRILDGKASAYKHGLGKKRSLQAYWKYAKVDWARRSFRSDKKFCV